MIILCLGSLKCITEIYRIDFSILKISTWHSKQSTEHTCIDLYSVIIDKIFNIQIDECILMIYKTKSNAVTFLKTSFSDGDCSCQS